MLAVENKREDYQNKQKKGSQILQISELCYTGIDVNRRSANDVSVSTCYVDFMLQPWLDLTIFTSTYLVLSISFKEI